MKIKEQTDSRIVLKDRNIFGYVFGGIFLLIGLISLFNIAIPNVNTHTSWPFIFIAILVGSSAILLPTIDTIIFDKNSNTLKIRNKNIFWDKNQEYDISKIKQLELWEKRNPNGRGTTRKLMCVMTEGSPISLSGNKSSSGIMLSGLFGSYNLVPENDLGDKISSFIHVPFIKDLRPLTVGESITAIKDTFKEEIEKAQKHEGPYSK